jgi:hypothetical protein
VRRRRNGSRNLPLGAARLAGSLVWLLWVRAARRPVDSFAIFAAVAASLIIIVNALVLQSGSRSAPFLASASPQELATVSPKSAQSAPPAHAGRTPVGPQSNASAVNDPIAQLIGMSTRIMAVQRVLSDYGYGQIRPSGILDEPTIDAIEKFERGHDLPATGRISDRLVSELEKMIGHPLE